jgi:geranylgeranyl pyrophosphate synthase
MINFESHIKECKKALDECLNEVLSLETNPLLIEPLKYVLKGDGKKIRPLLLMTVAKMFTGTLENTVYPALSLECVHSFSLVHDDLPCMDNDDIRRGKPTLHKVFGEAVALLVGDYLLNLAFQLMASAKDMSEKIRLELILALASMTGNQGIILGQILDVESLNKKNISENELQQIHHLKTGALFQGAMKMGAMVAGTSQETVNNMTKMGALAGEAFQIMDDMIDFKEGKKEPTNCIYVLGLERAKKNVDALYKEIKKNLQEMPYSTELLESLLYYLVYRKHPPIKN